MKKFKISGLITVSCYTEIEANSEDEALSKAELRTEKMMIVTNNGDLSNKVWMIEELDGEPRNLSIDD